MSVEKNLRTCLYRLKVSYSKSSQGLLIQSLKGLFPTTSSS